MKALNKISQISAVVFGLGALVLFFFPFADVYGLGIKETYVGSEWAFGAEVMFGGAKANLAISSKLLFVLITTAFSAVLSIFGLFFNKKGLRYTAAGLGLFTAVYTLVCMTCLHITKFIDVRPVGPFKSVHYTIFAIILLVAMFLYAVASIAHLFLDDYIVAKATGGKTIAYRVVHFFRDYKSEVKKIVWPGWSEVVKNTGIVLVMCAVVGALIWLVDWGLGNLIQLILGLE